MHTRRTFSQLLHVLFVLPFLLGDMLVGRGHSWDDGWGIPRNAVSLERNSPKRTTNKNIPAENPQNVSPLYCQGSTACLRCLFTCTQPCCPLFCKRKKGPSDVGTDVPNCTSGGARSHLFVFICGWGVQNDQICAQLTLCPTLCAPSRHHVLTTPSCLVGRPHGPVMCHWVSVFAGVWNWWHSCLWMVH